MWRLPGLLSRALHRLHVLNTSSSVHGIPTLPGNEELRNATSVFAAGQTTSEQSYFPSPDWHRTRDHDGREHGNTQRPFWNSQPHYTVLNAFSWGALTVLALQLARQIPWLSPIPGAGRKNRPPWVNRLPHSWPPHQHSEEHPFPGSWSTSLGPAYCSAQQGKQVQQKCLEEAAVQLQQVFRFSISIALNILGIESVRDGHYKAAYSCFKLSADRGYSKAQFNVGMCYEHGRGTEKDLEKAALYYRHAANNGHSMAQYRYARYLLRQGLNTDGVDAQKAVFLLEQAAAAGLVEAQAYLGVFYMKGLQSAKHRALKYLWLAARNGLQRTAGQHFPE